MSSRSQSVEASAGGRRLILNLSSRNLEASEAPAGTQVWSGDDVRSAFSARRLHRLLGRFDSVDVVVDDRRSLLSIKPQIAARLMARRRCRLIDPAGEQSLGWRALGRIGLQAVRDGAALPRLRREVDGALDALESPSPSPKLGAGPPLYVRADLWYGVRAGGSLGHIAGVLKGLKAKGRPAVLATTEAIPTIPDGTGILPLAPRRRQLFQAEWQQLIFNLDMPDLVRSGWSGPPPRFVYQRHGLNVFGGLGLARQWGVPFVLEYNGPEVWVAENWGRPLAERDRAARAETAVLRGADLVVAVSDVLAEPLRRQGVASDRILVLPNAVDPALFTPARTGAEFRAAWNAGSRLVVGFIGTFGPWHGVEVLVEAFADLLSKRPDLSERLKLVLVGDGARAGAVRGRIAGRGLADTVLMTGLLPQERGPEAIAAFDIALAPTVGNADGSPFFGSPTKLFEYMAAGKAVVASGIGQVSDVIADGESGVLVPPGDVGALAAAIERLADDEDLRRRLGRRARQVAEVEHSCDARAEVLLAHLERWS